MLQKKRKFDTTAFLFIAPAFILFTVFLIVPTVSSFYYSFTSWDGINPNIKFIGFDNYKEIFYQRPLWQCAEKHRPAHRCDLNL